MKNTKSKIRLYIIEDNRILRDGIASIIQLHTDIEVVASSGNSENMMLKIKNLKPNIILLDLGLSSQNSLRVVEMVKKKFPEIMVIIMDIVPIQADILQFIKAGACGFVLKDAPLKEFLKTIRAVAGGESILPHHLTESLFSQIVEYAFKNDRARFKDAVQMTKREKEIIELISDALTNKEIAGKLNISELTVKSHVHHILEKLALHSRLELANLTFATPSK